MTVDPSCPSTPCGNGRVASRSPAEGLGAQRPRVGLEFIEEPLAPAGRCARPVLPEPDQCLQPDDHDSCPYVGGSTRSARHRAITASRSCSRWNFDGHSSRGSHPASST